MIDVIRSRFADGRTWMTLRLACDICDRRGPGQSARGPAELTVIRARLRLRARMRDRPDRRWSAITILERDEDAGELVPHRIDLCPSCRYPARRTHRDDTC